MLLYSSLTFEMVDFWSWSWDVWWRMWKEVNLVLIKFFGLILFEKKNFSWKKVNLEKRVCILGWIVGGLRDRWCFEDFKWMFTRLLNLHEWAVLVSIFWFLTSFFPSFCPSFCPSFFSFFLLVFFFFQNFGFNKLQFNSPGLAFWCTCWCYSLILLICTYWCTCWCYSLMYLFRSLANITHWCACWCSHWYLFRSLADITYW